MGVRARLGEAVRVERPSLDLAPEVRPMLAEEEAEVEAEEEAAEEEAAEKENGGTWRVRFDDTGSNGSYQYRSWL